MPIVPLIVELDAEDLQCATIFVDGFVEGKPYRFVLDTGASRTQLVADRFLDTLESKGEHRSQGVFSQMSQRIVLLQDVSVGPLRGTSIEASVTSDSEEIVHSLLGMDLLRGHRLHFAFDREVLIVDEEPFGPDLRALEVDDRYHLYVEAQWPTTVASCVWDSGAGMTIIDHEFWSKNKDLFSEVETSIGTDAAGIRGTSTTYEMRSMLIGGFQFAPHHVAVVDLSAANSTLARPMDIILGYPTLRQANWFFDVPQRLWGISRFL